MAKTHSIETSCNTSGRNFFARIFRITAGSARRTEELVGTDHRVRRFTPHTITTNTKKWGIGPGPPVKRRRRGHLGRWPSQSRLTLACRGSPGTAARSRPSSGRTGPSGARPFLARPPPHRRPSPTSPEAGELVKKLLRSSRRFPLAELGVDFDFDERFFMRARALVRVVG
ncbi:hypothetical protein HPB51_011026 [Rhipicephalus microplus]|uniref:Uncharacterized protein n=1 Tax=Rhipicephalus microplus TaxID=6941 RepID=A0A9J6DG43_RHIMP|nr:hypothetical protein HPB51_011026 [Rhipicephalus microplus]